MTTLVPVVESARLMTTGGHMPDCDPGPKGLDEDRELATAGQVAKIFGVTKSWINQLARQGRLRRRGWQRVGQARWPLYDVEEVGRILGRPETEVD